MPVSVSAKRALRGSTQKQKINRLIISRLEVAIRKAKKVKTTEAILTAVSLADRAVKKRVIHKNKSSRIKGALSKLSAKIKPAKKSSKKK